MTSYLTITPGPVPENATEHFITTSDGVRLATDVYLPVGQSGPFPAVLIRLPYDKNGEFCFMPHFARIITARGYAAVIQDVRGKFRSEGATEFGRHEVEDGWDTLEWISVQPWSDGRIGMCGDSYYGMTSLAGAMSGHRALKAIAPRLTGTRLSTTLDGDVRQTARLGYLSTHYVERDTYLWEPDWSRRPLRAEFEGFFAELGRRSPGFDAEFEPDSIHVPAAQRRLIEQDRIVPVLFTVGWFDNCAVWSWHDIRALLQTPWAEQLHLRFEAIDHENTHLHSAPMSDDPFATEEARDVALRRVIEPTLDFFDRYVRDLPEPRIPRVQAEICHGDTCESESWPPPEARESRLYLSADEGTHTLAATAPVTRVSVAWEHDPSDPVPSVGKDPFGILVDWHDLSAIAERGDVVQFTGPVVERDETYAGPVTLSVPFRSTVEVTHLHTRLLDIDTEGRAFLIAKGQTQVARSAQDPVHVDLLHIGYRLRAGHRLALQLMSSDFPHYALAPGDGGDPFEASAFPASRQAIEAGESAVLSLRLLESRPA
jgi:putative CocE/NonD family hydrolase